MKGAVKMKIKVEPRDVYRMNRPGKYSKKANRIKEEDTRQKEFEGKRCIYCSSSKCEGTRSALDQKAHVSRVRREDISEELMYAKRRNPEAQGEYQKTLLPVHMK